MDEEVLYGEVVLAKSKSFPWWPSCVYDPVNIPKHVKDKHLSGNIVVYYYGTNSWGFVESKHNIELYNDESKLMHAEQLIEKKYFTSLTSALEQADQEKALSKLERVAWNQNIDLLAKTLAKTLPKRATERHHLVLQSISC